MSVEKNSRWWEFYYVRYFVGTIFGTIIIIGLTFFVEIDGNSLLKLLDQPKDKLTINKIIELAELFEFVKVNFWIFLLIGLAYCYLASAPILVFHAYRASFFKVDNNKIISGKKFNWIVVGIYLGTLALILESLIFKKTFLIGIMPWVMLTGILILQIIIIVTCLYGDKTSKFYSILTEYRQKEKNNNSRDNYIESYKHLREHGNAFLILLMELLLGLILVKVHQISHITLVIVLWILPATSVWILGTILEAKLIEMNPNKRGKKSKKRKKN